MMALGHMLTCQVSVQLLRLIIISAAGHVLRREQAGKTLPPHQVRTVSPPTPPQPSSPGQLVLWFPGPGLSTSPGTREPEPPSMACPPLLD